MPFDRLLAGALQPSVLQLDPAFTRALFVRDLQRTVQARGTRRAEAEAARTHTRAQSRRADWLLAARALRHPPRETTRPTAGDPHGAMLDAIRRDAALQQYDTLAPEWRRIGGLR